MSFREIRTYKNELFHVAFVHSHVVYVVYKNMEVTRILKILPIKRLMEALEDAKRVSFGSKKLRQMVERYLVERLIDRANYENKKEI
jgi:hypothetical protein